MNIRNKIALWFSLSTLLLAGIAFFFVYTLFAEFRKEEFQDRLREKITTTIRFLQETRQLDHDLLQSLGQYSINLLYQENLLLFDDRKTLIYSGIDDTPINFSKEILHRLSAENPLVETQEGEFDVVGFYFEFNSKKYYGISKAYDTFGFSKLEYLRNVLILTFIVIAAITLLVSYFVSKQISQPIQRIASQINLIKFDSKYSSVDVPDTKDEINLLAQRFNELMHRLETAFAFQKHAIHHISHELKTPIAVLVSNFERMERETSPEQVKMMMAKQKEETRALSDIINILLEIAKIESNTDLSTTPVRIDELLYDITDEQKMLHPEFQFQIELEGEPDNERLLTVMSNERLLKSAFSNLAANCVKFSDSGKAKIVIVTAPSKVTIEFSNSGKVILEAEYSYLFRHFFRGENSKNKRGFGLGLVLAERIIKLHGGEIEYEAHENRMNIFRVSLPLS